eukprot:GFUD01044677.1.p1 GENE.GFUD01044677.1~~GFUD01044677.1.p1  ORF type:complete len:153 (+),score=29.52 GFUD01044677.1:146-604(+)
MPVLQKYVLEPRMTGDFDKATIEKLLTALEDVLDVVVAKDTFQATLRIKLEECFGHYVSTLINSSGNNLWILMTAYKGVWSTSGTILVLARFHSVRSLQDLAAYQVARSVSENNLEKLPIPKTVKARVARLLQTVDQSEEYKRKNLFWGLPL